jgi:predicted dehydrogenase
VGYDERRWSRREFLEGAGHTAVAGAVVGAAATASLGVTARSDHKVRLGVVGGGFGAAFQWHEHPNCVVHAVSDLRTDRRDTLMKTYRCDRAYESLEKLILDRDLDAVAVFTGAPDHARHCLAAMNAGKHVVCAVPVCMTLDEAQQLRETKERTGLRYMMAETSYYRPETIAARDLYGQGKFGELFYSEVEYYHPLTDKEREYYYFYQGKRTWRYGFPPIHYPTHSTGFLVGVTRERLVEVSCLGWGNPQNAALKDNAYKNPFSSEMGLFKTDKGHLCRCGMFLDGRAHGERAQWFGTKLALYMAGSGGQPFRLLGEGAPEWKEPPTFWERLPAPLRKDSGHGGSHTFLTHEFITALVENREPAVDLYEALAMTAPGIIAHQSALRGGEQMRIPSFDRQARS